MASASTDVIVAFFQSRYPLLAVSTVNTMNNNVVARAGGNYNNMQCGLLEEQFAATHR